MADGSCLFCLEFESVQHVFFECVVAKQCWCMISEVVKVKVGDNLVEIGKFWLSDKKHGLLKHYYFCSFMKYLGTHE